MRKWLALLDSLFIIGLSLIIVIWFSLIFRYREIVYIEPNMWWLGSEILSFFAVFGYGIIRFVIICKREVDK